MSAMTEIESIVVQESSNAFGLWRFQSLDQLGLKEADLENAILAQPKSLIVNPLELYSGQIKSYSQTRLRFGNSLRRPDVIILTEHADVVVVEVKRLINDELRDGRRAIAQVVEYAALLATAPEAEVTGALTKGQHSSWDGICQGEFESIDSPNRVANKFRQRVGDGDIHLVIACDSAPPDLADMVRAASNLNALGFALHVIEVRPMVPDSRDDTGGYPIAWVPWPRLDTEIVHRTSVTVRAEGFSLDGTPSISLDVKPDSADVVKEKLAASGRKVPKYVRYKNQQQEVLQPLAESLGLQAVELWEELDMIHQAVMEADWTELYRAIAGSDDKGPMQRGNNEISEGRYGVNLLQLWKPSVFVGAYLLDHDHKQALLDPDNGGDFALILDVGGNKKEREAFGKHTCFTQLRERLSQDAGDWDFPDHYAQANRNLWHPLHLRRPLRLVIGGTDTLERRTAKWLDAAQDAVELLLAGGELAQYRRQVGSE